MMIKEYISDLFPTWPEYVIEDMLVDGLSSLGETGIKGYLGHVMDDIGDVTWVLKDIEITYDCFCSYTQRLLDERDGGNANPYDIPNDAERHALQAKLLKEQGISKDPIIVIERKDGYELAEGWHRTIQTMLVYPEGYIAPAWIATGKTNPWWENAS